MDKLRILMHLVYVTIILAALSILLLDIYTRAERTALKKQNDRIEAWISALNDKFDKWITITVNLPE